MLRECAARPDDTIQASATQGARKRARGRIFYLYNIISAGGHPGSEQVMEGKWTVGESKNVIPRVFSSLLHSYTTTACNEINREKERFFRRKWCSKSSSSETGEALLQPVPWNGSPGRYCNYVILLISNSTYKLFYITKLHEIKILKNNEFSLTLISSLLNNLKMVTLNMSKS